ncbi:MAG: chemotaxis protein CheW, partial [Lachnospiraceae bacterium]|nr:chemotaxis protein CheW [Lachnospiraceae bacterium]
MEIVIFKVNGYSYGMDIDFLEAIEELDHITPVANAPKFISGISNVRGEVVPVFDLAGKFSINETDRQKKYVVVR